MTSARSSRFHGSLKSEARTCDAASAIAAAAIAVRAFLLFFKSQNCSNLLFLRNSECKAASHFFSNCSGTADARADSSCRSVCLFPPHLCDVGCFHLTAKRFSRKFSRPDPKPKFLAIDRQSSPFMVNESLLLQPSVPAGRCTLYAAAESA
jgi:hypothetical protein